MPAADLIPAWALFAASPASLLFVLGALVCDWLARRSAWLENPSAAPRARTRLPAATAVALLLGVSVAIASMLRPISPAAPASVLLCALGVLACGHVRTSRAIGCVGLTMLCEAIAIAPVAWGWTGCGGVVIGAGLAGLYSLWLARFWAQQLDGERAWTTAGRLIPSARMLAIALAVIAVLAAVRCASG